MKKLLLTTAIVGAVAFAATPAKADIQLGLGGHFKGYISYVNQDELAGAGNGNRNFDIVRDTEIHFTGETTLDNGLTVGFHSEALTDGANNVGTQNSFDVEESYVYFAGNWGRVNFGSEDGAAYLLQVAAPSADNNYDGIRQYVNGTSYATGVAPAAFSGVLGAGGNALTGSRVFDYDAIAGGNLAGADKDSDKFTYITPVFSGFQAAASYSPDLGGANSFGNRPGDTDNTFGSSWELAARYEGQFNAVRVTLGAGYTNLDLESQTGAIATGDFTSDVETWDAGLNLGFGPFNVGGAYLQSNNGDFVAGATTTNHNSDSETWVLGADYTTGPFVLGASYYDQNQERGSLTDLDTTRYAGGVTYTYGPGMSFRGSVSHIKNDVNTAGTSDFSSTNVLLGTQINF